MNADHKGKLFKQSLELSMPKPDYPAELQQPIIAPKLAELLFLHDVKLDEIEKARHQYINLEHLKKLKILCEYYGLDMKLMDEPKHFTGFLNLLTDHIEGFKVLPDMPKGAGQPDKWLSVKGLKFYALVKHLRLQGLSLEKAIEKVQSDGHFKTFKPNTLKRRWYDEVTKQNKTVVFIENILKQNPMIESSLIEGLLNHFMEK